MSSLSSVGTGTSLTGSSTSTPSTTSSTSLAGLNTSGISFSGLSSGLDTTKIIQGLLAIDQARITALSNNQQKIVKQQTAFKSLEAQLLTIQTNSARLSRAFGNVIDSRTATSSSPDLVTASAASGSAPGIYSFRVNALAQTEQRASQGYASANASITQGTLQLRVGSGATSTVTVDNTNNTLQGLANAINNQTGDVTASVVNDGSATTPYRLLLTSKKGGAANTITVTDNLAADANGAVNPNFSTVVQTASDASITLGSGAGALTISSPTNQIDGVFSGVTLNLQGADPTKTVNLTVDNDTATASSAIHDLVSSFNDLIKAVNAGSTYDRQTGTAGIFLGNQYASQISASLSNAVSGVVTGIQSQANRLSAVGITLTDTGTLAVDDAKLTKALSGQLPGISASDVSRLFSLSGQSDNSGVQFIFAGDKTATGLPVQVQVTQAATQASLLATNALAGTTTIDGTNNALALSIDGRAVSLTLAQGSYTAQSLVSEVQGELNASAALNGASVLVGLDSTNHISLTSQSYGSSSQVSVSTSSATSAVGLTAGASASGQNVAGNYVVNGVAEAASGKGQILSGLSTNTYTSGLQTRVSLTSAQITPTPQATVTVTQGIASQLGKVLDSFLDPVNGRLKTIDQSYQDNVNQIQKEIDRQTAALQDRQQALALQFAALEATISQLQAAGGYLTGLTGSTTSSTTKTPTIG